ncbi:hypothetical protein K435DRAFT_878098 [Dendrothele bispora CBS 962.96]|uniref:Uncharacterized protein n=1 Tax=Dendrothele bispora (strain CBS 962.96) TaxID=1314807 RepID=A0A4S8KNK8_DENBC|nr:hypothetical protein K435DRAFT_878098 [Dendrothele bispora CBS 962.96]
MSFVLPFPDHAQDNSSLSEDWVTVLGTNVTTLIVCALIFGIQLAAYTVSLHILIGRGLKGSYARCLLVFASLTMILSSGIILGSIITSVSIQIKSFGPNFEQTSSFNAMTRTLVIVIIFVGIIVGLHEFSQE